MGGRAGAFGELFPRYGFYVFLECRCGCGDEYEGEAKREGEVRREKGRSKERGERGGEKRQRQEKKKKNV